MSTDTRAEGRAGTLPPWAYEVAFRSGGRGLLLDGDGVVRDSSVTDDERENERLCRLTVTRERDDGRVVAPAYRESFERSRDGGESVSVSAGADSPVVTFTPFVGPDDDETVVLLAVEEAADERETKAALERSTARLATIIQNLPMGVLVEDEHREVLLANETFTEQFGVEAPPSALVGADCAAALEAALPLFADPEGVRRDVEALLATGTPELRELVEMADGRLLERSYLPTLLEGEYLGHIWLYADVTEAKGHERELRLFKQAIDATDVGIAIAEDTGDRHSYVNDTMLSLLGIDDAVTYLDSSWREHHPVAETERLEGVTTPALREGRSVHTETTIRRQDGSEVPASLSLTPVGDGQCVVLVRDISERVAREEALESQNARLKEFASVVSHDLRNPIGIVNGWLSLYRETGDETALDRVAEAGERMDLLVEDLLRLARNGQTVDEKRPVSLCETIGDAWSAVETGPAALVCTADSQLLADEHRLEQVFTNLFQNAVEHAGPTVTVRVGATADGFYVEDDGPGIPPKDVDSVFDHGYTTSRDGTGYGLAIVRAIAEAHGWALSVGESTDGGARFVVSGVESPAGSDGRTGDDGAAASDSGTETDDTGSSARDE
jgi:PAS domain S-box-containing protein